MISFRTLGVCILFSVLVCGAQETETPQPQQKMQLSLRDCMAMALEHEPEVELARVDIKVAEDEETAEDAAFDLSIFADTKWKQKAETSSSALSFLGGGGSSQSTEERFQFEGGIRKTWSTGTITEFSFNSSRVRTNSLLAFPLFSFQNPQYQARMGLEVQQPLLQGGWFDYNLAAYHTAQHKVSMAREDLEKTVLKKVAEVEEAYWNLVFARRKETIQREALHLARQRLAVIREKVLLGKVEPSMVVQTESSVASREEALVVAEAATEEAEEMLKEKIQPVDVPLDTNLAIVVLEEPQSPGDLPPEPTPTEVFLRRPEFRRAQLEVANAEVDVARAWNEMLPRLDLKMSYDLLGVDDTFSGTTGNMTSFDDYEWEIDLSFEYPLGNRAARSRHHAYRQKLEQAKLRMRSLARQITRELSDAIRKVSNALKHHEVAERNVRFAQRKLEAQQGKLDVGKTSLEFVLDSQNDLADAKIKQLDAHMEFVRAHLDLHSASGTRLEPYGISFQSP